MTVTTTLNRIEYSGNDSTTDFSFPYLFYDEAHLEVYLTDAAGVTTLQALTTDYTTTGEGNDAGGTVSMVTPPATGETLLIVRVVPITQLIDYISGGAFPAETHERGLDLLTQVAQQQQEELDRAIVSPLGESYHDAGGKRVTNSSDAVDGADLTTLDQVQTILADAEVNPVSTAIFARKNDIYGELVTGGASNAYTLTPDNAITAYAAGQAWLARANHTNTGNVTLNVSSQGATSVVRHDGTEIPAGGIVSGAMYLFAYSAGLSKFVAIGTPAAPLDVNASNINSGEISNDYLPVLDSDRLPAASTTAVGGVELATDAEAEGLADTTRALTAANLAAVFVDRQFEGAEIAVSAGTLTSQAHGFASIPTRTTTVLRCKTAEFGYSVGEEIHVGAVGEYDGTVMRERTASVSVDGTNCHLIQGADAMWAYRKNAPIGDNVQLTAGNWKFVIRAFL